MNGPLLVAQSELTEALELLKHARIRQDANKFKAVSKTVAAFKILVNDPVALQSWWDSFSADGQQLMLDSLELGHG